MRPLGHLPGGVEPALHRYAGLPMEALRIRADLLTGYVPAELETGAVHLDGLLGWALIQSLPYPVTFPAGSAAVVPVPLKLLWVSPDGLPLWAASPLVPVEPSVLGREYWHKRYPSHRADLDSRTRAWTAAGRWKEYRVPVPVRTPTVLEALAIGHAKEILALLEHVPSVGRMAKNYGHVARWDVEPAGGGVEDAEAEILRRRITPLAYWEEAGHGTLSGQLERRGWTPPYWFLPWHAASLVPAPVAPPAPGADWFEAASGL